MDLKDIFISENHSIGADTERIKNLFERGLIVFDSNAYADIYLWDDVSISVFTSILEKGINERLYMPFQVGIEFIRIRTKRVEARIRNLQFIENSLTSAIEKFKNGILQPIIDLGGEFASIEKDFPDLHEYLNPWMRNTKDSISHEISRLEAKLNIESDVLYQRLNSIYKNKIGEPFGECDLLSLIIEGEARYNNKIPPGFEDKKDKDDWKKYGDLVIWEQMMKFVKGSSYPGILFVTNDKKPDWRNPLTNQTQPMLVQEFFERTGLFFWSVDLNEFNTKIKEYNSFDFLRQEDLIAFEHATSDDLRERLRQAEMDMTMTEKFKNYREIEMDRIRNRLYDTFRDGIAEENIPNPEEIYENYIRDIENLKISIADFEERRSLAASDVARYRERLTELGENIE